MAEHILEMVRKANPESIEKYIKNHLSNDSANLERIYKELLAYAPKIQAEQIQKPKLKEKTQSSINLRKRSKTTVQKTEHLPIQIKRSISLIKQLQEKGLKVTNMDEELGINKSKVIKEKLTKPQITNSKLLKSEEALIDRLINRYTINSQYYNNQLADVKIDMENVIDRQMREFIDRRQTILQSFKNKTNNKITTQTKFSFVSARVYQPMTSRTNFEEISSLATTRKLSSRVQSTKKLMNQCNNEIKQHKYRQINTGINFFRDLKQNFEDQEDIQAQLEQREETANFKQKLSKEQYDRYTNSYMKMMNNKIKTGSKCKLNAYAKELLRDQRKMRNIIDFSNK